MFLLAFLVWNADTCLKGRNRKKYDVWNFILTIFYYLILPETKSLRPVICFIETYLCVVFLDSNQTVYPSIFAYFSIIINNLQRLIFYLMPQFPVKVINTFNIFKISISKWKLILLLFDVGVIRDGASTRLISNIRD